MVFYLGVHRPYWLWKQPYLGPLFVSRRTLGKYKRRIPKAKCDWALDSGGFTEIQKHGEWTISADEYIAEVRRFVREVGRMKWASIQDWMCEDKMLRKTGLTIRDHQQKTIANYLELQTKAPDIPWIPVLQGQSLGDYVTHIEDYTRAGVDLVAEPIVGVGSVCRRQSTIEIHQIMERLASFDLSLHGFGVKTAGLRRYAKHLASADSMAWSYAGRKRPLPLCPTPNEQEHETCVSSCANCPYYAKQWRDNIDNILLSLSRQGLSS